MSIAEIQNLPLRQKLQILEVLWNDLNERAEAMGVTPVERELLDHRLARVRDEEVEIHEWDSVKKNLGKS